MANGGQPMPTTRAQKTVIAHFNKPFGQNMLQKPPDEFHGGKGAGLEFPGVGRSVAKGHFSLSQFQDAVVADGHPKDVRRQVLQGREAIADRLAMHDPGLLPYRCWNEGEK